MPILESPDLYKSVENSLKEEKFHPIYFFFGEESYLVSQALHYVKTCALYGTSVDFNFSSYYAADAEASRIRDEVDTLPMMASRRVVLVKEAQDFSDKEWEELMPILESPVDSTVLIFSASKMDKRKKYFKTLMEKAQVTEFRKPFENQIPGWIRHIAKVHQLTLSESAEQLFHRLVGNQLHEIEAEIKKLSEYVGERRKAELEDVAQCVSKRREDNVFDFTASLARGDRFQSLLQLGDLLQGGQNEIGIVMLVARHMRILLTIKQGQDQGLMGQKLAGYAQVPNYFMADYLGQSRIWTFRQLQECLLILSETDRALKSSPLSSHIWLENLVLRCCALVEKTSLRKH